MAQPPDERDPLPNGPQVPDERPPGTDPAPAPDAPTVPWTPPPAGAGPEEPATAPPLTPPAAEPYFPGSAGSPTGDPEPPASQSPLISWAPSGAAPSPDAPPGEHPGAPLVGWQVPPERTVDTAPGFVLAGIAPRLVAYFMDATLVALLPTLLSLVLIDYGTLAIESFEQAMREAQTGVPGPMMTAVPITLELVLITVISTALSFLYFVGFWTSSGGATLGMRGLRLRVVDATGGSTLTLMQAIRRWIAFGYPLGLLALVPPFQSIAGLLQVGVSLVLLITAATDDRRQGLHDRWADSLVIRSSSSGGAATAVGCLILILVWVGLAVLVSSLALNTFLPELIDVIEANGGFG